jgi:starch synthase
MMKGITPNDVKILEKPDYINVNKLAINFADAVVFGSATVQPELEKYIRESGKKILPYQPKENYIEAYSAFYDNI